MINDLSTAKPGDKVFLFEYSTKTIREITRTTDNFLFVLCGNNVDERKFRRKGGYEVGEYSRASINLIKPGEIEAFEKEKVDKARINEIIKVLDEKGFKFNGYTWYSIEVWEKLIKSFEENPVPAETIS